MSLITRVKLQKLDGTLVSMCEFRDMTSLKEVPEWIRIEVEVYLGRALTREEGLKQSFFTSIGVEVLIDQYRD